MTSIGSLGDTRQHHPEKIKEKKKEVGVQVSLKEEQDIGKSQLVYVWIILTHVLLLFAWKT